MAEVDLKIPTKEPGVKVIQIDITIAAGTNPTQAFTFARAFAAVPRVISCIRNDTNATDPGKPEISVLSATGGTLRLNGTSTVTQTYFITLIGNYNNATAY